MLLLTIICTGCVTENEPDPVSLLPGDRCPEFSVTLTDGSVITTSDLAGRKSLLLFFNTSCGDCRAELPVVQSVYEQILSTHNDVNFLCISRQQDAVSVEAYWQENNLTMPVSAQDDRTVYSLFASSVIPRIYILSPDLTITSSWDDDPVPSAADLLQALAP